MCGCTNNLKGFDSFDSNLVQQVAEQYSYISSYGDRMRSIDEDYGQYGPEFLAAVDKIYNPNNKVAIRTATANTISTSQYVAPPNGKKILTPNDLKIWIYLFAIAIR